MAWFIIRVMLKIRLGKVVVYANRDQHLMRRAVAEFFGDIWNHFPHDYFAESNSDFEIPA